jgi:hypothetical protein
LSALIGAGLRALLITLALVVTIIGIPWAIARLVRWSWFGQAVMLDGASGSGALAASAGVVRGHWWRVLGISVLLLFVGSVLGPLIGIPVMIAARAPLELVNGLSSVIYAFTHPFAVIGSTILYQQLKDRR